MTLLSDSKAATSPVYNVRDFGAKGDGVAVDSPAINAAIDAASQAGGGTVVLPAGRYLSYSVRLKSNLKIEFSPGARLVAARYEPGVGRYDAAEPNEEGCEYQDFGHSHWQNSLIWGSGLENISITGPGFIDGSRGITRHGPGAKIDLAGVAALEESMEGGEVRNNMDGVANKALALKNCRNITLRDFTILNGGHFAILATGVDNFTLDNLKVDTNRDAFDIDNCRNVRISNCSINTPNDDAIVLKSSYALGRVGSTENVTISNCLVCGFDIGSMLDGSFRRTSKMAPDREGPTGRIKIGTESNGSFRNITIANCVFERSRGLALETVDGGTIEDVVITNISMRELSNPPIFLRVGNRARGPKGSPIGAIRRIKISHITASDADMRYPVLIAGLPGHPIEDITLSDIHVVSRGGFTMQQIAEQPTELVNSFFLFGTGPEVLGPREPFAVPERPEGYPEPCMFGLLPAAAIYARHVRNLTVRDMTMQFAQPDQRPTVVLEDVNGAVFEGFRTPHIFGQSLFVLRQVNSFETHRCTGLADMRHNVIGEASF